MIIKPVNCPECGQENITPTSISTTSASGINSHTSKYECKCGNIFYEKKYFFIPATELGYGDMDYHYNTNGRLNHIQINQPND